MNRETVRKILELMQGMSYKDWQLLEAIVNEKYKSTCRRVQFTEEDASRVLFQIEQVGGFELEPVQQPTQTQMKI